jgi:hypothetical protein
MISLRGLGDGNSDLNALYSVQAVSTDPVAGVYVPAPPLSPVSQTSSWLTQNATLLVAVSAGLGILAFIMGRK